MTVRPAGGVPTDPPDERWPNDMAAIDRVAHICGCLSSLIAGLEPTEEVIDEVQDAASVWERDLWPFIEEVRGLLAELDQARQRPSTDAICVCGHSTYWHGDDGSGECEHDKDCHCGQPRS